MQLRLWWNSCLYVIIFATIILLAPSVYSFVLPPKIQNVWHQPSAVLASASSTTNAIEPVALTVVIPAYNEVDRIGPTLSSYSEYLCSTAAQSTTSYFSSVHILVVDDGSTDKTADLVESLSLTNVTCISLAANQGKGAAVAFGIEQVEQEEGLVLVADADGSANIECLVLMMERMIQAIDEQRQSASVSERIQSSSSSSFWSTPAIVVGNRGSATDDEASSSSTSQQKILLRSILRWGFRTTVQICLVGRDLGGARDTQCGFKLLTIAAAQPLYSNLNLQRWTHDVEVLFRASSTNVAIAEQPIEWQDKDGSKLVDGLGGVAGTSLSMLLQVLQMRLAYELGIWE